MFYSVDLAEELSLGYSLSDPRDCSKEVWEEPGYIGVSDEKNNQTYSRT